MLLELEEKTELVAPALLKLDLELLELEAKLLAIEDVLDLELLLELTLVAKLLKPEDILDLALLTLELAELLGVLAARLDCITELAELLFAELLVDATVLALLLNFDELVIDELLSGDKSTA